MGNPESSILLRPPWFPSDSEGTHRGTSRGHQVVGNGVEGDMGPREPWEAMGVHGKPWVSMGYEGAVERSETALPGGLEEHVGSHGYPWEASFLPQFLSPITIAILL